MPNFKCRMRSGERESVFHRPVLQRRDCVHLTITKIDEGANTVQLGFTREEEALKALYHNEVGVGSRRVVRRFMELTPQEQQQVAAVTAAAITIAG